MSYVLGITGGIGAGKSTILNILKNDYNAHIIVADEVAHRLMEPGGSSYEAIVKLLGNDILAGDSSIDRSKMAAKIFADNAVLQKINEITHPLVIDAISVEINALKTMKAPLIVVETAVLPEGSLDFWCDSICYVYVPDAVRQKRLIETRHYTSEKCHDIMSKQATDAEYRAYSDYVIDNSSDVAYARIQIHSILEECGFPA